MDYKEIISELTEKKEKTLEQLEMNELAEEEMEELKRKIDNYDYIIEMTKMNHFERGAQ